MVVGEALKSAMARRGVDIGIVNYQDMGNWGVFTPEGPSLHMQIYGRATTATIQKYGEAVQLPRRDTGFYDNFEPLDSEDIAEIKADILALLASDKYSENGLSNTLLNIPTCYYISDEYKYPHDTNSRHTAGSRIYCTLCGYSTPTKRRRC